MIRQLAAILCPILMICRTGSADPAATGSNAPNPPLAPAAALASFELEPGLAVELVAAEPLVASPCAVAWDERGRMYVAENRGYPVGGPGGSRVGSVALLEDTNADGLPDKRSDFATGLAFPNGVLPWRGGLIVTDAPDVLYLKDTDNDGKADVRDVLLTGFSTSGSTQLRVNDPTLGPDGWVYLAGGLVGGKVRSPKHPDKVVDTARHDVSSAPTPARSSSSTARPSTASPSTTPATASCATTACRCSTRRCPPATSPATRTSPRPASCTTAPSSSAT